MSNDMSNNKKKIILPMIIGLLMVITVIGVTYAFFNYTRTGPANTLNTGRIYFSTEQTNNNTITLNNIFPMTKEQALSDSSTNGTLVVTFNGDTEYTDGMEYLLSIDSVTGTANVPISLIMDVNITENSVALTENTNYYTAREGKTASMYKAEGENVTINSTSHKVITDIETGKYLLAGYIKSGEYGVNGTVTIKAFIDADNLLITDTPDDQSQRPSTAYTDGTDTTGKTVISTDDWNTLQSSGISFKVKGEAREGIWVKEILSINTMYTIPQNFDSARELIKKISFNKMNNDVMQEKYDAAEIKADLTYNNEGKVLAWLEPDTTDNTKYIMYIVSNGETYLTTGYDFITGSRFTSLESIEFNNINTSRVTNMSQMFIDCNKLTSLDLSKFNTTNVTNMQSMFWGCSDLLEINLTSFNTTNVTSMNSMFNNCSSLVTLDLSSFDTSSFSSTAILQMFNGCSSLTTIYVGENWNTSTQPAMMPVFTGCTSLIGGAGTIFDSNNVGAGYAHVDGGTSNPGYLTLKQS